MIKQARWAKPGMGRLAAVLAALMAAPPSLSDQSLPLTELDAIFESWSTTQMPGCAAGVAREGTPVLLRASGMADLEQGVANTPETIFEGGVAREAVHLRRSDSAGAGRKAVAG
jgi:CubicO group peptidase (beta-lactamase class C family)